VVQGLTGLPVFAGLKGGIAVLFGPTGGYILGFIPAAFVVGWLLEKGWYKIYAFGLPWLAFFVGWDQVMQMGFLPFLPGDLLKMSLAVLVIRSISK
jgi:biotin transport system substrate-specific component